MQHAMLAATAVAVAAGWSGTSWSCGPRSSPSTRCRTSPSPGARGARRRADARVGLFGLTIAVAVGMGALGRRGRPDDVVVGGVFAWVLGLGVLFLTIYNTTRSAGNGSAGVAVLFGSVFGMSGATALAAALVAAAVCVAVVAMARPLLFASLDEQVAAARGVPVRLLGYGFLVAVGLTAAEATQVVGALLILGLLAAPAGAAILLTARPPLAMAISVAIAVGSVWVGLPISYAVPDAPPSFTVVATAVAPTWWRRGAPAAAAVSRRRGRQSAQVPKISRVCRRRCSLLGGHPLGQTSTAVATSTVRAVPADQMVVVDLAAPAYTCSPLGSRMVSISPCSVRVCRVRYTVVRPILAPLPRSSACSCCALRNSPVSWSSATTSPRCLVLRLAPGTTCRVTATIRSMASSQTSRVYGRRPAGSRMAEPGVRLRHVRPPPALAASPVRDPPWP
jgi:zinc/manganese transport system permease protein